MKTSFRVLPRLALASALTTLLLSSASMAFTCHAVDLRSQLGEIRDQGRTGWCHSFAAADLLSAKVGYQVASVDIARSYYADRGLFMRLAGAVTGSTNTAYPGTSAGALESALEEGVCPESIFPFEKVKQSLGTPTELALRAECDRSRSNFDRAFRLRRRVVTYGNDIGIQTLREELGRGNVVAIDYDVKSLLPRTSRRRASFGQVGHSSTVVAMRTNPSLGECEFLVRGSWGRECTHYDPARACEDGSVWVSESDISYMMFALTWLDDRR